MIKDVIYNTLKFLHLLIKRNIVIATALLFNSVNYTTFTSILKQFVLSILIPTIPYKDYVFYKKLRLFYFLGPNKLYKYALIILL